MSAGAALAPAAGRLSSTPGSATSTGPRSGSTSRSVRVAPSVTSASASWRRPVASFVSDAATSRSAMLGERSRITSAVSGRPPAASASQPRDRGRPTAKTTAATASIRSAITSQWRSRE